MRQGDQRDQLLLRCSFLTSVACCTAAGGHSSFCTYAAGRILRYTLPPSAPFSAPFFAQVTDVLLVANVLMFGLQALTNNLVTVWGIKASVSAPSAA